MPGPTKPEPEPKPEPKPPASTPLPPSLSGSRVLSPPIVVSLLIFLSAGIVVSVAWFLFHLREIEARSRELDAVREARVETAMGKWFPEMRLPKAQRRTGDERDER